MSKNDMLGKIVRELVTIPEKSLGVVLDLLEKLFDPNWIEATKLFLRKENPWPESWRVLQLDLLSQVIICSLHSFQDFRPDKFFNENFQEDGIRMELGKTFKNNVLAFTSPESSHSEITLNVFMLMNSSFDKPIFDLLGGKRAVQIGLACLAQLIKRQPIGEEGTLLTDGKDNHFFYRNTQGVLLHIFCHWDESRDLWYVGSSNGGDCYKNRTHGQIFTPAQIIV